MLMRTVHVRPEGEEAIPVRLASSGDTTLLECDVPDRLLAHLTGGSWTARLTSDAFLRGVLIPGVGALFSICGPLGVIDDEVVRLSVGEAQRLIPDLLR